MKYKFCVCNPWWRQPLWRQFTLQIFVQFHTLPRPIKQFIYVSEIILWVNFLSLFRNGRKDKWFDEAHKNSTHWKLGIIKLFFMRIILMEKIFKRGCENDDVITLINKLLSQFQQLRNWLLVMRKQCCANYVPQVRTNPKNN